MLFWNLSLNSPEFEEWYEYLYCGLLITHSGNLMQLYNVGMD